MKKMIQLSLLTAMMMFIFSACGNNATVNDSAANTANQTNATPVADSGKTEPAADSKTAKPKTELHTPAKDSPERTAIMDALRIPVGKELKQEVIFAIDKLKVQGDWAFLAGQPKNKDGGEPNWKITEYQEMIDNGDFEPGLYALLKNTGGKWSVVTYMMNCHDVCYAGWDKEFKAPKAILE